MHLVVLAKSAISDSETESQVLCIPIIVPQKEKGLVQLSIEGGQVVQVAAHVQQFLQEEARQRQL